MAIKIRKRVEAAAPVEEQKIEALEPEVLPPEGQEGEDSQAVDTGSTVNVPGMEDKFLSTSNNVMAWLMEHRRAVGGIVGFLVLVALIWNGVIYMNEKSATEKSMVMSDAFVTYTALTKAQADEIEAARMEYMKSQGIAADAPDILRVTYTVPDDQKRHAAISQHLENELPKYAADQISASGQLMLAGSKSMIQDATKASAAYDTAVKNSTSKDVQLFAKLGQVEMLIGAKNYDGAIAKLDEIMKENATFSAHVMLEKGRIYEMTGKTSEAIAAYDEVANGLGKPEDQQAALSRLRVLTPDWASRSKAAAPAPQAKVAL